MWIQHVMFFDMMGAKNGRWVILFIGIQKLENGIYLVSVSWKHADGAFLRGRPGWRALVQRHNISLCLPVAYPRLLASF
jgi:hypothetical protein